MAISCEGNDSFFEVVIDLFTHVVFNFAGDFVGAWNHEVGYAESFGGDKCVMVCKGFFEWGFFTADLVSDDFCGELECL